MSADETHRHRVTELERVVQRAGAMWARLSGVPGVVVESTADDPGDGGWRRVYERVAASTCLCPGGAVLAIGWWAPAGSSWRPDLGPRPGELRVLPVRR